LPDEDVGQKIYWRTGKKGNMRLKVGIVGLRRGLTYLRVFSSIPGAEVAAVCDTAPGLARQVAKQYGVPRWFEDYGEMLDSGIDITVICTPAPLHARQSIEAMKRGVHVLSEVPAAYTLEECESLVRTAKETRVKYMMAENYVFFPFIESWKRIVDRGLLGRIIYAEGEYVHDCRSLMRTADGRLTWRASLPPIKYCTHTLGPLLHIMRDRCVVAVGMHTGCNVAPDLGAIDMEVGIFRTENGAVIKLLNGFSIAREPMLIWFTIYGTRGVLEGKRCGWDDFKAYFEDFPHLEDMIRMRYSPRHRGLPQLPGGHGSSEQVLAMGFVKAVLEDSRPPIDVYDSVNYTAPGICAHISAENGGKPVEIPVYKPD